MKVFSFFQMNILIITGFILLWGFGMGMGNEVSQEWKICLQSKNDDPDYPPLVRVKDKYLERTLDQGSCFKMNQNEKIIVEIVPGQNYQRAKIWLGADSSGILSVLETNQLLWEKMSPVGDEDFRVELEMLRREVKANLVNGVKYAALHLQNLHTGSVYTNPDFMGREFLFLERDTKFKVRFYKPGYPDWQDTLKIGGRDTTIQINWQPASKAGIFWRSMVLPGWGHSFSSQPYWWAWMSGGAFFTIISAQSYLVRENRWESLKKKHEVYINEPIESRRLEYLQQRNNARESFNNAETIFQFALLSTGLYWGVNALNALANAAGPDTRVRVSGPATLSMDF